MSWTVYEHITPNGKRYIGITCNKPGHRWNDGRGYKKGTAFRYAIDKYGWDKIQHNILETGLSEFDAKCLEEYYICSHRTFVGFSDCNGYNMTLGGEGTVGAIRSEVWKKKQSDAHKFMCGENNPMYGKHLSEETKKKISEKIKGTNLSEETRAKMSVSHKGEKNPNYGKHFSDESIDKMRKVKIGKHRVYREDGTYFYQ